MDRCVAAESFLNVMKELAVVVAKPTNIIKPSAAVERSSTINHGNNMDAVLVSHTNTVHLIVATERSLKVIWDGRSHVVVIKLITASVRCAVEESSTHAREEKTNVVELIAIGRIHKAAV